MNRIRIAGKHYQQLKAHLYPGDQKEAVAVAICGRSLHRGNHTLLVQELLLIPYEACLVREHDNVQWPTEIINPPLERAAKSGLGILKIHSHPGGYERFSGKDDRSDDNLFTSIHAWLDDDQPHASCIMLPDGRIFGRFFNAEMLVEDIHQVSVAGSDILNWYYTAERAIDEEIQVRNTQTFGSKTILMLNRMKIGVVGCSGTGSPSIEQLKRLGAGELVLVDPDFVDVLNLNRIVGSTRKDAEDKLMKVEVMKRGIDEAGFGTATRTFPTHISYRDVIKELADCDILFGCVDGAEGRHVLNLIASYYLVPYFDLGVKLFADGDGGIDGIFGTVHYIQPLGSSLWSRGQYSLEAVRAESLKRIDHEEYKRNRYLDKVNESSPAVITINMQVSAAATNEFLGRIHPYRNVNNTEFDTIRIMFSDCVMYTESFPEPCAYFSKFAGIGDIEPILNGIEFS
jgi:hypothetical protein